MAWGYEGLSVGLWYRKLNCAQGPRGSAWRKLSACRADTVADAWRMPENPEETVNFSMPLIPVVQ